MYPRELLKNRNEKPQFNADKTRYIAPAPIGWACYEGSVNDEGNFCGAKTGVARDREHAEKWLETADRQFVEDVARDYL